MEENEITKDINDSLENDHEKNSPFKSASFNNDRERPENIFNKVNNYKTSNGDNISIPHKDISPRPINSNMGRNDVLNRLKNNTTNQMLNKVSNIHPALKAANALNNLNKAKKGDEQTTNNVDTNSTVDGINERNPINSILDRNNGFKGKFSFIGTIPFKTKIILFSSIALFGFLFLILIPLFIIGMFSGLFGLDDLSSTRERHANNINYGDYILSSDGHSILHEPLSSFLESKGSSLEEFNGLIKSNVNRAGYGTRAGVVAATVTLVAELGNKYEVKLPYFWGGGHGQVLEGALSNWGSSECHTYANGTSYNYCGLDCSGFATWAIYNGGFNIQAIATNSFQHLPGAERVTLTDNALLQPGDLLESTYHVAVVVKVEDDGYLCAEASGNSSGILFTKMSFKSSDYWGVKMDGFYNTQVRS